MNSVRILEILKKINFTGECRIKTDNLTIRLTEKEGICHGALIETEEDETSCQFTGLKDSLLIKKITEINPLGKEIRLYTRENKRNELVSNIGKTETADNDEISGKDKYTGFPAEKSSNNPNSLFEDELSNLDTASIIKMKEKFRREMEKLASDILDEKNE